MSTQVGYKGLGNLNVGDQVEYKAGRGDWRVEAAATVTQKPGTTGVYVRLDNISVKGAKAEVAEGDEVIAGAREVYN